jgi:purine-binding chemotaxis protein CheW
MASIQLVVFELDEQEYGINVGAVNGILRSKKFQIQRIPGMPKVIDGMINLRGKVSYIFNLRVKFGLVEREISDESKFIMLNIKESITGCIVDEVTDIVKLNDEDVQPPPTIASDRNIRYIKGIGKVDERLIVILDPEQLLSSDECETIDNLVSV